MGYIDDYQSSVNSKIPYDDTPIARREEPNLNSRRRKHFGERSAPSRIFMLFLAISLIINICLCITTVYYIINGVKKTIIQQQNQISMTGDISSVAATTAKQSTICVSAGVATGYRVSDEKTFYTNTLSHGAGVIYKIDRENKFAYFITCHHVIDDYESDVYILLPNYSKPLKVNTVGYSSRFDVAVLSYSYSNSNDPIEECNGIFDNELAPQYYESYNLAVGETVFAVGNPLPTNISYGLSITGGLVSRLNTFVKTDENNFMTREIQISAEINPGNSGGGLFNNEGKFIGIVNATRQTVKSGGTTTVVYGMSFALPGTFVVGIARSIIQESSHKATNINLGANFTHNNDIQISYVPYPNEDSPIKFIEQFGVVVDSINAGSISSGKLQKDDIINSFTYTDRSGVVHKDVPMYNMYVFEDISFDIKSGTDIIFNITRPATRSDMVVTIKASATQSFV